MCRIVRVPLQIKCVPDYNTGENMARESEQADEKRSEKCGKDEIHLFIFQNMYLSEYSGKSEECKRYDIVEKYAQKLSADIRYPCNA